MRALLLLPLALLAAGCTSVGNAPDLSTGATDAAGPAPGAEPTILFEGGGMSPGEVELDLMCVTGGGITLARQDNGSILPGVTKLVGTFSMTSGTGWQLGYEIDDAEIVWIDPLGPGTSTFEIPVDPSQTEEDGERWTFWHQANLPEPLTQECYTGAILNGWSLKLETALG